MASPTVSGRYPDRDPSDPVEAFCYFDEDLQEPVKVETHYYFGVLLTEEQWASVKDVFRLRTWRMTNGEIFLCVLKVPFYADDAIPAVRFDAEYVTRSLFSSINCGIPLVPRWYGVRRSYLNPIDGIERRGQNVYVDKRLVPSWAR